MSPKGQHAKSKARISSFESLLSQESAQREKDLEIFIPAGPRLGDLVGNPCQSRGVEFKEAERRAWATVNKETHGGKQSGSGRGTEEDYAPSRKGGRLGGRHRRTARPASDPSLRKRRQGRVSAVRPDS